MLPLKNTPSLIEENIAEDLTDIFTAIAGVAELAEANPKIRKDLKLASYIDQIRKSGQRGGQLVRQWVIDNMAGKKPGG